MKHPFSLCDSQALFYLFGDAPCPLPLPGTAWGPLACSGGPPLGPGARVTGLLGFGAASDTSFCTLTPFPAVPGFILVDLLLFSGTTSVKGKIIHKKVEDKWINLVIVECKNGIKQYTK